jgi:hypothetical protein
MVEDVFEDMEESGLLGRVQREKGFGMAIEQGHGRALYMVL